jgi:hypothetical protein
LQEVTDLASYSPYPMGKQYNKRIKRRRRTAYLARQKAALLTQKASAGKKAVKSPAAKAKTTTRKKAATKPAPKVAKEEVAEKAKPDDVLGPDEAAAKAPAEEKPAASAEK